MIAYNKGTSWAGKSLRLDLGIKNILDKI